MPDIPIPERVTVKDREDRYQERRTSFVALALEVAVAREELAAARRTLEAAERGVQRAGERLTDAVEAQAQAAAALREEHDELLNALVAQGVGA